uniref:Secreted protein n=1 Tax=Globodera pallida TaxID=36090 RepID=A0A183C5C9_GLOPA
MLGMLPTSPTIVGMMLLLLMVHQPHCAADDDPVEIMRKFTVEYNILSGPAYDVLEHLSVISEKAKFFMKLSGPVGSIIAACVETAFPPEDPMMRALAIYHQKIERRFVEQNGLINSAINKILSGIQMDQYNTNVHVPMRQLQYLFNLLTDPNEDRKIWKSEFVSACNQNTQSPIQLLQYIDEKMVSQCKKHHPSQQIRRIMADVREIFSELGTEETYGQKLTRSSYFMNFYLIVMEAFYFLSDAQKAAELSSKLKTVMVQRRNANFTEFQTINAITKIFNKSEIRQPFDTCYLQTTYEANDLRRRPLLRLAEIIKHDTVKLATIGSLCANLTNEKQPRVTEAKLKQIGELMSGITANVSEWIQNELKNAWPEDIIGKAKKRDRAQRHNRSIRL